MKSRESRLRLQQFELDEKRRKVADIETMVSEFRRMADDLDLQIAAEEQRAGVSDINHFAYPSFAKAARQRRDNLLNSVAELNDKLEEAQEEFEAAMEEMKKAEATAERALDAQEARRASRGTLSRFATRPY